jgi:ADP-ribose pyrophosphatase YjhB (NUDIX family)
MLIAVDCIIFGFDGKDLKALLIKRSFEPGIGEWSLMGGFIRRGESTDNGAARILENLTGLKDVFMEQLYCFGEVDRDPGGRVVSIAYFALIKIADTSASIKETNAKWIDVTKIPPMIFDHGRMIKMAKERLQQIAATRPIGFELLDHKFTLPQLQNLYEAIYETTFDKRNFCRKIKALHILTKLETKEKSGSKKGAFFYKFDYKKYKKRENESLKFI